MNEYNHNNVEFRDFFPFLSFVMEIFVLYSQTQEFNFVSKSPVGVGTII